MPCYRPLSAWRPPNGGRLAFSEPWRAGHGFTPLEVPCGQCIGCRLEYSRVWALRCMHEAGFHEQNCFVTLTYSPEALPANGTLVKAHFQDFMKRLRERIKPHRVRYFHCGEYGEKLGRPHYHALFFGYDFPDKTLWQKRGSFSVWRSALLEECWSHGQCEIGSLTFQSAAYVARYVVKKVTGDAAAVHYSVVDADGVVTLRLPEYVTMSRNPGIGSTWSLRYMARAIERGFIWVNGVKSGIPRYYLDQFHQFSVARGDRRALGEYQERVEVRALSRSEDNTVERLADREEVTSRRVERLFRKVGSS